MNLDQDNKSLLITMAGFVLMFGLLVISEAIGPAKGQEPTYRIAPDTLVRPGQVWTYDHEAATTGRNGLTPLFLVTDTTDGYTQYQREDGTVGSENTRHFRQNKVCVKSPKPQLK